MNVGIINKYYVICGVLFNMFKARNYCVSSQDFLTKDEFTQLLLHHGTMFDFGVRKFHTTSASGGTHMHVFFPNKVKTGVKELRDIVNKLREMNMSHAIIVLKQDITPFASNRLRTFPDVHIEQFCMDELSFTVTDHIMVPPHRLIHRRESRAILDRFGLKSVSSLKHIQQSDPMCRYYNAKIGQVFEISRSSPEGHQHMSYRVVVRSIK